MAREADNRRKVGIYLMRCMQDLGITPREAAKAIGVELRRLQGMESKCPQERVLAPLAAYIESVARQRRAEAAA